MKGDFVLNKFLIPEEDRLKTFIPLKIRTGEIIYPSALIHTTIYRFQTLLDKVKEWKSLAPFVAITFLFRNLSNILCNPR